MLATEGKVKEKREPYKQHEGQPEDVSSCRKEGVCFLGGRGRSGVDTYWVPVVSQLFSCV